MDIPISDSAYPGTWPVVIKQEKKFYGNSQKEVSKSRFGKMRQEKLIVEDGVCAVVWWLCGV